MKRQKLIKIQQVEQETNVLSISRRDKYKGNIRRQYDAFLKSSSVMLKEVERLEGIIYPQFLAALRNGEIHETGAISIATAHAGRPIKCPRTDFRELPGYMGEVSSIFGASVEQMIYDEMWLRSIDSDFRSRVIIPEIRAKKQSWSTDRDRWQKYWELSIHSHYGLPHIEADFQMASH